MMAHEEDIHKESHTDDTDLQIIAWSTKDDFFLLQWCLLRSHPFLM